MPPFRPGGGRTTSRRAVLRTGILGGTSLASWALNRPAARTAATTATAPAPVAAAAAPVAAGTGGGARSYRFSRNWLFGGRYAGGSEKPGYNDSRFARITLPHTVVPLSWGNWDHTSWEGVWIYRKHFPASAVAGGRVFADFDGVMTNATVVLNGVTVGTHQGGYLPWSAELTRHLRAGDNVLAVIVDSRWLNVPPDNPPGGTGSVDFLQPGGIYRDVTLRVVPEVFISDVFARPDNVLASARSVAVRATIDAAAAPAGPAAGHRGTARRAHKDRRRLRHRDDHRAGHGRRRADHHGDRRRRSLVTGEAQAVHGQDGAVVRALGDDEDRVPRGGVRDRRLLPQRRALQDLRPEPPPAFPLHRDGRAGAAAAARRADPARRAQLQHGALLALPAVPALPRRLRRAGPHGLGGAPRLGLRRRRRVPGHRGAERPRHDRPRPQPPLGHRLGDEAQRDRQPPRPLRPHPAARLRAGRKPADDRRRDVPLAAGLGRGRLRL